MAEIGESSSSISGDTPAPTPTTLRSSTLQPPPVVLDRDYREEKKALHSNPREDLWLSTVDGRYSSKPIPVRVGKAHNGEEVFYVHHDILTKSQWFQKALSGEFREADDQAVDLPEEDPAIFHFLIAHLYESKYNPIKAMATALDPVIDKGKGLEPSSHASPSLAGPQWDLTETDIARRPGQQRDDEIVWRVRDKMAAQHRQDCNCLRCVNRERSRCWSCGALATQSPAGLPHRRRAPAHAPAAALPPLPPPPPIVFPPAAENQVLAPEPQTTESDNKRLAGEDLRSWLMAYELSLEVYICANRYLMDSLKKAVARTCIDMLETAGTDAAVPEVLYLCRKLYAGLPEGDPLLKMVLARVGFLQPQLWKTAPMTTSEFLIANPDLAAVMLRETAMRHEADTEKKGLPTMEGHLQSLHGNGEQRRGNSRLESRYERAYGRE